MGKSCTGAPTRKQELQQRHIGGCFRIPGRLCSKTKATWISCNTTAEIIMNWSKLINVDHLMWSRCTCNYNKLLLKDAVWLTQTNRGIRFRHVMLPLRPNSSRLCKENPENTIMGRVCVYIVQQNNDRNTTDDCPDIDTTWSVTGTHKHTYLYVHRRKGKALKIPQTSGWNEFPLQDVCLLRCSEKPSHPGGAQSCFQFYF